MKGKVLLKPHIVFWYDNNHRQAFNAIESQEMLDLMVKRLKPIRIAGYMTQGEMIEEDQKLWRKLNN